MIKNCWVIMGKIVNPEPLVPARMTLDASNRLTLPRGYPERTNWIKGTESLQGWLLLLSVGRYRLLSDEDVMNDPRLEPVRTLLLEGKPIIVSEPTSAEEPARAVLVACLIPVTMTPPPPGWRICLPKSFNIFIPGDCDAKDFTIFLSLEGYWEIWYTDILVRTGQAMTAES